MNSAKSKLNEVAKKCSVSTTTVTRAFQKESKISDEKREEILSVSKKLGYEPRSYKKTPRKKRKKVIGLIGDCELCSHIVDAIDPVLTKEGFSLIIGNTSDNPKLEIAKLNEFKNLVDAFLIVPCMTEDPYNLEFIKILSRQIPTILLIRDAGLDGVSTIYYSLYTNNENAIEKMIKNGHRNIVLLSNILGSKQNTDKILAYQDALRNFGIPFKGEYLLICESKSDDISNKVKNLLITHPEITAFVSSNRVVTIGMLTAFNELGIKVKENMAVVANFNSTAIVNSTIPLSCIKADHYTLGMTAASQIMYMMNHFNETKSNPIHIAIETQYEDHGTEAFPKTPISDLNLQTVSKP